MVALEYPGAVTATFTMTAFSQGADRSTRLFGTKGELSGDGRDIRVYDFLTRSEREVSLRPAGAMNAADGHAGGDGGLMDAFTAAVASGDPDLILSGPRESLASHLAVFAAERARRDGTVETLPPLAAPAPALSRRALPPEHLLAGLGTSRRPTPARPRPPGWPRTRPRRASPSAG